MKTIVLIVAAGSSLRFGRTENKVYHKIGNQSILEMSIQAFKEHNMVDDVCVVINAHDIECYKNISSNFQLMDYVIGGSTRKESVYHGLNFLSQYQPKKVLIHDAARPFVSARLISEVIKALDFYEAVDTLLPVVDTIKYYIDGQFRLIERENLYQTQTPQGFLFPVIHRLHKESREEVTDDISLCLKNNISLSVIQGEANNYKITFIEDLGCK